MLLNIVEFLMLFFVILLIIDSIFNYNAHKQINLFLMNHKDAIDALNKLTKSLEKDISNINKNITGISKDIDETNKLLTLQTKKQSLNKEKKIVEDKIVDLKAKRVDFINDQQTKKQNLKNKTTNIDKNSAS